MYPSASSSNTRNEHERSIATLKNRFRMISEELKKEEAVALTTTVKRINTPLNAKQISQCSKCIERESHSDETVLSLIARREVIYE